MYINPKVISRRNSPLNHYYYYLLLNFLDVITFELLWFALDILFYRCSDAERAIIYEGNSNKQIGSLKHFYTRINVSQVNHYFENILIFYYNIVVYLIFAYT